MGVLSDVFAANPADITPDLVAQGPMNRLPCVEGQSLMPTDLEELLLIIEGKQPDDFAALGERVEPIASGEDCSVCEIPRNAIGKLVQADEQQRTRWKCAWWKTSEDELR